MHSLCTVLIDPIDRWFVLCGLGLLAARLSFALTPGSSAARGSSRRIAVMPPHGKKLRHQVSDVQSLEQSVRVTNTTTNLDQQQAAATE